MGRSLSSTARSGRRFLLRYSTDWSAACFCSFPFVSSALRKKNRVELTFTEVVVTGKPLQGQATCGKDGSGNVVVVVVVEILRLHVLKVHPKPGPFHRVIWAMKPRQCISVQFSAVHPISE